MNVEQPVLIPIAKIIDEADRHKTLVFKHALHATPGQFVMLWLPRVNQKPFSISYRDKEKFAVTVLNIGPFTEKLCKMKEGESVGIQGPYGNGYTIHGRKPLLVGGGCGTASLALLADDLTKSRKRFQFIIGAKTRNLLLYQRRYPHAVFATDDGSHGHAGFVTEVLEEMLRKHKADCVYSCGPEIMMKKVSQICDKHKVPYQLSLERYMKCGFGVCGACCMDPVGARVCCDGPVFNQTIVPKLTEFGTYKRDGTGKVR